MIYEETEDNPSLTIMEMLTELTLPMMMILAIIGLITVCRMAVQSYRRRQQQPRENYVFPQATVPRRGRVAHRDHKRHGLHD